MEEKCSRCGCDFHFHPPTVDRIWKIVFKHMQIFFRRKCSVETCVAWLGDEAYEPPALPKAG